LLKIELKHLYITSVETFDMLAVPTYCSEADGYSAHKGICFLSLSATCLDAHPVPAIIHLITRVAKYRHSTFWKCLIISHLLNKNMCAVAYIACYMSGSSWFSSNLNP